MICYSNYNEVWANNVLYACGCQAALLYHIEFGNHYTCKFLFLYAQGPRASLDWIYKSVCYRTGMLPFDHLRGPVCNAPQVAFFRKCLVTSVTLVLG